MADKFATDDQAVLGSGKPLLHLVELFPSRDRLPEWYTTNKYPIFDDNGTAAVCGIVQNYEQSFYDSNDAVSKVVKLIKNKFDQTLSIPELSKKAGLSQRQLERLFKKRFSITPREYIIRLRVLIAADQLRFTSKGITEIALDCGSTTTVRLHASSNATWALYNSGKARTAEIRLNIPMLGITFSLFLYSLSHVA